jgi:bacterioferritin (cytochrome b1)
MGKPPIDPRATIDGLNAVLPLQARSALQLAIASGALTGLAGAALSDRLAAMAAAELAEVGRMAAKIVALGGEPTLKVAPLRWPSGTGAVLDWLAKSERETIDAFVKAIPDDADDAPGEAMEHVLEHAIQRKIEQVELLERVRVSD